MKVVVSGGGTGGHIYPAIAIANKFKKEDNAQILYIGTKDGLESKVVPKEFDFKTIEVTYLRRKINFDNIKRVFKSLKATLDAIKILKKFKPDLIIGTGGYVSGPVILAGKLLNIKTAIHEQNSYPGITNKIAARFCNKVMISFLDAKKYFKHKNKVVLTGNPIRQDIIDAKREDMRKKLNLKDDEKFVLCVGGSGGSLSINNAMKEPIKYFLENNIKFMHVTGERFYNDYINEFENVTFKENQNIVSYLNDIVTYLTASDLVISSGGAIFLAEVSAKKVAPIIIPKAYTAENHQEHNARALEKENAGICILEKELNDNKLFEVIKEFLEDNSKIENIKNNMGKISQIDAIDKIYNALKSI
ncbi:undecaprenyldiphospho-muramoylpentapeptide beta-N-acetylglucosaminyltransferase [Peptostreptococcaceae bacterium AGR-M142]